MPGLPDILLSINGDPLRLSGDVAPTTSLHDALRLHTRSKGTKLACGEGGCGACAVQVARCDPATGAVEVRTLNACLAMVGSLEGCAITTAEGIGSSAAGFHRLQERFGECAASQCGFCTPGFVVAAHAAGLRSRTAAARRSADPYGADDWVDCRQEKGTGQSPTQRPGLHVTQGGGGKGDAWGGGGGGLGRAGLQRALDGNLCRCTGYRPILDACQDLEDLCASSHFCTAGDRGGSADGSAFPSFLLEHLQGKHGAVAQSASVAELLATASAGRQRWCAPATLAQLFDVLEAADVAEVQPRLVGGNTGAGVYKGSWPHDSPLVVDLTRAAELRAISQTEEGLECGAAVTLAELAERLQGEGGQKAAGSPPPAAWQRMAAHLLRIGGTHVRCAATLGGNLVLARERGLQSDLAPLLAAAGATIGVASRDSTRWLAVEDWLDAGATPLDLGASQVLAALRLPRPGPHEHFWSHKVAPRYFNAHALVNMAVWLRLEPHDSSDAAAEAGAARLNGPATAEALEECAQPASEQGGGSVAEAAGGGPAGARGAKVLAARIAVGAPDAGRGTWRCGRAQRAEAALAGARLVPAALVAALRALRQDLAEREHCSQGAGDEYPAQAAEGLLFQALAPLTAPSTTGALHHPGSQAADSLPTQAALPAASRPAASIAPVQPHGSGAGGRGGTPAKDAEGQAGCGKEEGVNSGLARLLTGVGPLPPPGPLEARQDVPPYAGQAPVHQPVQKEGALLQASGEALFTSDMSFGGAELFAAFVESAEAAAAVDAIDVGTALALPGVVRWVGPSDIPAGGVNQVFGAPLFAEGRVEYVGQPLGLVLATSQAAALRGAAAVKVAYSRPAGTPAPIYTIQQAIAAESYYDMPSAQCQAAAGDVEAGLAAAEHTITGARYTLPSQQHLYMEPQAAAAAPDEDGCVHLWAAAQSLDGPQAAAAAVLGVPLNKVTVACRRVGGAFGGKATRALPVAAAAALAAHVAGRPVRLTLDRGQDCRMNGGRCSGEMEYDVGFNDNGKITALRIRLWLQAGAYQDLANVDVMLLVGGCDSCYAVPALDVSGKLCRTNIAPRTIMRAPGCLQAAMVIEQVLEHVAAALGADPATVREANFLRAPEPPAPRQDGPRRDAPHGASRADAQGRHVPGGPDAPPPVPSGDKQRQEPAATELPRVPADDAPGGGAAAGADQAGGTCHPGQAMMRTALGKELNADLFTLPRIWAELKAAARYAERAEEVAAYNARHAWRKRGLSMTPCRFDCAPQPKVAAVSIFSDGSVALTAGGIEMGQGLATKVKQVAAYELGLSLPEAQRPFPLSAIRIADTSSAVVPNGGPTWGSTGSESACAAVAHACAQLRASVEPALQKLGAEGTWAAAVGSLFGWGPGLSPASTPLTAIGFFDGTQGGTVGGGKDDAMHYSTFGAAITEVEIDVLTGEKVVRRSDLLFDCGRSLNPAVDVGQVEGAFVMGLGVMTSEEVAVDPASGRLLSDSTWTYKIPTAADIPRVFNVAFLKDSPNPRGILSSKASGEPALLLSVSALAALRAAAAAAAADVGQGDSATGSTDGLNTAAHLEKSHGAQPAEGLQPFVCLAAPATPGRLRRACGSFWVADVVQAALQ